MFQKLQDKWKVNGVDFVLIFLTFAAGGSLCGIAGKKIMELTGMDKGLSWLLVYIFILTLIWPVCVLLVSIPLGQFNFFKRYIGRMLRRVKPSADTPVARNPGISKVNIAIFASGAGTNAAKIISHFRDHKHVKVGLVVSNKSDAGVLQVARDADIPVLIIEKSRFYEGDGYIGQLRKLDINWLILAGFLWKVPPAVIQAWQGRIINIHPALLPKYGGKGMYGSRVHEAVIAAGEKESGISIHYVDEVYDNGEVILQSRCTIEAADTPESLAAKIHLLEHEHFPKVIEQEIMNTFTLKSQGPNLLDIENAR